MVQQGNDESVANQSLFDSQILVLKLILKPPGALPQTRLASTKRCTNIM